MTNLTAYFEQFLRSPFGPVYERDKHGRIVSSLPNHIVLACSLRPRFIDGVLYYNTTAKNDTEAIESNESHELTHAALLQLARDAGFFAPDLAALMGVCTTVANQSARAFDAAFAEWEEARRKADYEKHARWQFLEGVLAEFAALELSDEVLH